MPLFFMSPLFIFSCFFQLSTDEVKFYIIYNNFTIMYYLYCFQSYDRARSAKRSYVYNILSLIFFDYMYAKYYYLITHMPSIKHAKIVLL